MKTTMLATALLAALVACADRDATGVPAPGPGPAPSAASPAGTAGEARATATGTIDSIDAANHRIVISHGPVAALGWPAMTMGFAASDEQIAAARPGQRVEFEFVVRGPVSTLTRIAPAR